MENMGKKQGSEKLRISPHSTKLRDCADCTAFKSFSFMGDSWVIVGMYVIVAGPLFALYYIRQTQ